jgi:signal transduction histidine kinase/ligand-binding sensor domain-containing protein
MHYGCLKTLLYLTIALKLANAAILPTKDNVPVLSEYTHRAWHVQDGLPDQVVQALAQTPDQYLWVGTNKGLLRFDGDAFEPYSYPALHHGVTCFAVAKDGSIYIGTEEGGLLRLHENRFEILGEEHGLGSRAIRALYLQPDGTLWVGADAGLYRSMGNHFVRVVPDAHLTVISSTAILEDGTGAIWSGGTKLIRVQGNIIKEIKLPGQNSSFRIRTLLLDEDGSIWAGTTSGLYRRTKGDIFAKVPTVVGNVRTLVRGSNAKIWVGTSGHGLFLGDSSGFVHVNDPGPLPSNTILSQLADSSGNMWLGTQSGLLRLGRMGIHLTSLPAWRDTDFGALMRDRDGAIWVCSSQLFRLTREQGESYSFPFTGDAVTRTMMREPNGTLWLGTAGRGVYRIQRDGRISHFATEFGSLFIRGFIHAADGSTWVRSDNKFAQLHPNGNIDIYGSEDGKPAGSTLTMAQGAGNRLWIGSQRGLSSIVDGHFVRPAFASAFDDQSVWSIVPRPDGTLWIGADFGFYSIRNGQVHPVNLGSDAFPVYQVLPGSDGMIWIAGPTKVYRASEAAISRASSHDGSPPLDAEVYPVSAEIPPAELYGGKEATGVADPDGSAWFATSQGPVHLIPGEQPSISSIPMRIKQITVDGRDVSTSSSLVLPAGTKTLQIHFAPIHLSSQSGLKFQYRLIGFDDWSSQSIVRLATYTDVPPGHYRFAARIVLSNLRQVGSVELAVQQNAVFYRTPLFYALVLAILSLLLWSWHLFRLHDIKNEFRMVGRERNRIAREMHDTVIQGCTATSMLLEAAAMSPTTSTAMLTSAKQQIGKTIDEARDAVWNLRQEIDGHTLTPNLRKLLAQYSNSVNAACVFQVEGREPLMSAGVAHQVLMTAREALSNAVTHSMATRIDLTIKCSFSELSIIVSDNGCGFDEHLINSGRDHHYGLRGMRERIENLGGRFSLASTNGRGTRIQFDLPRSALHYQ